MNPAEATETTSLAHLTAASRLVRGTALIVGTVVATAIAVLLVAVYSALSGRFPYRAVLFVLGERSSYRNEEAPELVDLRSSPAMVPSLASGAD